MNSCIDDKKAIVQDKRPKFDVRLICDKIMKRTPLQTNEVTTKPHKFFMKLIGYEDKEEQKEEEEDKKVEVPVVEKSKSFSKGKKNGKFDMKKTSNGAGNRKEGKFGAKMSIGNGSVGLLGKRKPDSNANGDGEKKAFKKKKAF